jgi:Transposase IS4
MPIPRIFDDYNKYIGGVDIANQLRESYETHRKTFRVWFPLLYWLIDAIIINAYRLQYLSKKSKGVSTKELPTQIGFRQGLYKRLFSFHKHQERQFSESLPISRTNSTVQHIAIRQPKQTHCIWCRYRLGRKRQRDENTTIERAKRSLFKCNICNVTLCTRGACWEEFHSGCN